MSRNKKINGKPIVRENCVTVENIALPKLAKESVKKRNAFEKGKKFERIPIFRGFILREVK